MNDIHVVRSNMVRWIYFDRSSECTSTEVNIKLYSKLKTRITILMPCILNLFFEFGHAAMRGKRVIYSFSSPLAPRYDVLLYARECASNCINLASSIGNGKILLLMCIWDRFREKGPNAYIIKFPVRAMR